MCREWFLIKLGHSKNWLAYQLGERHGLSWWFIITDRCYNQQQLNRIRHLPDERAGLYVDEALRSIVASQFKHSHSIYSQPTSHN